MYVCSLWGVCRDWIAAAAVGAVTMIGFSPVASTTPNRVSLRIRERGLAPRSLVPSDGASVLLEPTPLASLLPPSENGE